MYTQSRVRFSIKRYLNNENGCLKELVQVMTECQSFQNLIDKSHICRRSIDLLCARARDIIDDITVIEDVMGIDDTTKDLKYFLENLLIQEKRLRITDLDTI